MAKPGRPCLGPDALYVELLFGLSPRTGAEGGVPAIEGFLRDAPIVGLSVLGAGLLVAVILGVVFAFATRHAEKREWQAGSLTELAFIHELRAQIKRLDEDTKRLREERDELLSVLTHLAELLEQGGEDSTRRSAATPDQGDRLGPRPGTGRRVSAARAPFNLRSRNPLLSRSP
jgi:hypothetical protein